MQSFFVFRPLGPPSMFYCCSSKELKRYSHIWKLSNNTALLTLKIFLTALIFECYGEMKFLNLTNLKNKEQLLYLYNKNKKKQRTVIIFILTETCNFKHFFSRKVVGLKHSFYFWLLNYSYKMSFQYFQNSCFYLWLIPFQSANLLNYEMVLECELWYVY